ncbi:methyl-accepting chemotaxis protein [Mesobacterium pallidum]|uniref:methyl-accepting chemotaxis protein n=1 Tax=Mesobacterium pallidum TaxID=2872037 RepID=UPI001EE162E7|nr:methyl-accepting chemotaxis protein [Mesobacterium pallidum]
MTKTNVAEKYLLIFSGVFTVIVVLMALWAGNAPWVPGGLSLAFLGCGVAGVMTNHPLRRSFIGLAFVGQAAALVAALANHAWQIDAHMVFFAALAALVALDDVKTIIVATALVAVHHLGLTFFLPVLVYPSTDLIVNLERTVFHALVVLIESAVLMWIITRQHAMRDEISASADEMAIARREAEEARDTALAAQRDAVNLQREAEAARAKAEEAVADLAAEQAQSNAANARALAAEEAERRAAEEQRKAQEGVVNELGRGLKALSRRDLTLRLTQPFAEEYEDLRRDFNAAMDAVAAAIREVAGHAEMMLGDSRDISRAAMELSARTEQQAAKLENTAAAMEEVTILVQNTAESASQAAVSAAGAKRSAENSDKVVERASTAMSAIDESAGEISKIIDVIDQIAFQTNLLALNAGVEAARAGDAGRGFAVVASEVRALAQRSSEAAKDIGELIAKSQHQVSDGVRHVSETVDALKNVIEAVVDITQRVDQIAVSAREQATGLGEINSAVTDLDAITQQNAAVFEETAAASGTLTQSAEEMKRLTDGFKHAMAAMAADRAA